MKKEIDESVLGHTGPYRRPERLRKRTEFAGAKFKESKVFEANEYVPDRFLGGPGHLGSVSRVLWEVPVQVFFSSQGSCYPPESWEMGEEWGKEEEGRVELELLGVKPSSLPTCGLRSMQGLGACSSF